ncbi:unnamed protein product [Durusdinium trenchii]|uniref:Pentatricopeptide repeat-containing protein, chloroplastic n=1 Tax=Durusdinium trenchii TaxID=1381693 RepID=A0ABP0J2W8_9DINO
MHHATSRFQRRTACIAWIYELSETDDPRSWSLFMGALGRQGLWELALESLRALRQKHDAEGDAPSSRTRSEQRLVASAMTACSRATQWSIALLLLGSTGKPDVKLLNAGIAACAKGGKWRRSLELLSEIQAQLMLPTVVSFGSIISACASGQAWPVAIQSLDLMTSLQIDPSVVTYSAAASACEKGHQWPMAFAVLQRMHSHQLQPNVVTFGAVISACEKGLQWQRVCGLLAQMRHHEVPPNTICCNAAISACEKSGEVGAAFQLFRQMLSQGPRPDTVTANALISSCEKGKAWRQALDLLNAMPKFQLFPDNISYNAAISACEKCHQWQWALQLLEELPEASLQLDVVGLNAAISACEKVADWRRALALLTQRRSPRPNIISFNAAIGACENAQMWREALELFSQGVHLGPTWGTFLVTISACGHGRRWEMALALKEQGLNSLQHQLRFPDAILGLFNAAITACEKARTWTQALEQLAQLRQLRLQPNVVTFSALISACEKSRIWEVAVELWTELHRCAVAPELITYNAVISACEANWRLVLELLAQLAAEPRLAPDLVTCNAAISGFAYGHQWSRALGILQGMSALRLQPSLVTYSAVWTACLQGGHPHHLLRLLGEAQEACSLDAAACELAVHAGEASRSGAYVPGSALIVPSSLSAPTWRANGFGSGGEVGVEGRPCVGPVDRCDAVNLKYPVMRLVDLTSSAVYAACCYRRFLYGPAFNHEGEIYLAAAASLIASWFYIVMFHLHRTQEEAHWSSSIELEWFSLKVTFSCVVGLVCGFLILESLCLCSIICNKEPLGPSAAFDVPLVGCCAAALQPPKTLREVVAFRDQHCAAAMGEFGRRVLAGYGCLLRVVQDIPGILLSSIDLVSFGPSWYAIFKLSASASALLFFLLLVLTRATPAPPAPAAKPATPETVLGAGDPSPGDGARTAEGIHSVMP